MPFLQNSKCVFELQAMYAKKSYVGGISRQLSQETFLRKRIGNLLSKIAIH